VNQPLMMSIMDAITDRSRLVNGKPMSLLDVGYDHVGLDDNWQKCNAGINGSFHDAEGKPLINAERFPDMKKMNDYAHSKKVKSGWYMNNCICNEQNKLQPNWSPQMHGDVSAIVDLEYDGVKIDGCGPSHDLLEWAQLLNQTGRPIMIENCHDNVTFPYWHDPKTFDYLVCPMNFWRVSDDIQPHWASIIGNLQHAIPYQNLQHPISQPGCWGYPDMLEVANGALTAIESRSHFGAWCIVSSPLILGFDLTNNQKLTQVWDIITNTEAIAISQTWAGHPGRLVVQAADKIILKSTYTDRDLARMKRNVPKFNERTMAVGAWQIWAKPTKTGQAAFLLNNAAASTTIQLKLSELGFSSSQTLSVRDIWDHKDLAKLTGGESYSVTLEAHDSKFLHFTPQ